jgi:hypothetical protein
MSYEISHIRVGLDPLGLLFTLCKHNRWRAVKRLDRSPRWELCAGQVASQGVMA